MPSDQFRGVALAFIASGSLLLYAAMSGKSVLKSVQLIVSGQSPALLNASYPVAGTDATGSSATGAPGSASTSGGGVVDNPSALQAYAFSQFSKYGWGTDQEQPLVKLWNQESGWNPNARNPSSGAAGIPQDITGNMHGGGQGQIDWGLQYIKGRYGTPAMAWAHEQANNWY